MDEFKKLSSNEETTKNTKFYEHSNFLTIFLKFSSYAVNLAEAPKWKFNHTRL